MSRFGLQSVTSNKYPDGKRDGTACRYSGKNNLAWYRDSGWRYDECIWRTILPVYAQKER